MLGACCFRRAGRSSSRATAKSSLQKYRSCGNDRGEDTLWSPRLARRFLLSQRLRRMPRSVSEPAPLLFSPLSVPVVLLGTGNAAGGGSRYSRVPLLLPFARVDTQQMVLSNPGVCLATRRPKVLYAALWFAATTRPAGSCPCRVPLDLSHESRSVLLRCAAPCECLALRCRKRRPLQAQPCPQRPVAVPRHERL